MSAFRQKEFEIIQNYLTDDEVKYLTEELTSLDRSKFQHDLHVPNAFSIYNFMPFVEVLCNKLHIAANIIQEPLLPGYTYARKYQHGDDLYKHTDRESCEVALSIHLYGDKDWPIFFEKTNGEVLELNLQPGDAIIYEGHINQHWREKYTGKEYGQFFLFYVKSRGKYASNYFDLDVQAMRSVSDTQRQKLLDASKRFKK
jgi:hypothetical protein